jgi:transposase
MDLEIMRRQGVHSLIAYCLNDACRHQAIIDVSSYPGDTPVPWFRSKVKCAKCGARGDRIDVRPNGKEAPGTIDDWSGRPAMPGDG